MSREKTYTGMAGALVLMALLFLSIGFFGWKGLALWLLFNAFVCLSIAKDEKMKDKEGPKP